MKFKPTQCTICKTEGEENDAIGRYIADDDCIYFVCRKHAKFVEENNFEIKRLT